MTENKFDASDVARKLRAIKALAEQGNEGERAAAMALIGRLKKKYGVTVDDVMEDVRTMHEYRYQDKYTEQLLHQIHYMVTGTGEVFRPRKGRAKVLYFECTDAEAVEIRANYEFYKAALQKDMDLFYSAFIQRNELFPEKPQEKDATKKVDPEDIMRILKMAAMMDKHTRLLELPGA